VTPSQILSVSGDSSINIYSTTADDFPIAQVLKNAHRLGCHHIVTSKTNARAVTVGFGGEAKVWKYDNGMWKEDGEIRDASRKAGELWAVVLSPDGQYLAGTTYDGRVNVWDLDNGHQKVREYETKGSFGMSIDLVSDVRMANGAKLVLTMSFSPPMDASRPAAMNLVISTCSRQRRPVSSTPYRVSSSRSVLSSSHPAPRSLQQQAMLVSSPCTIPTLVSKSQTSVGMPPGLRVSTGAIPANTC